MNKVLIIGQNGQVSTYLQRALKGDYQLLVADRQTLDLAAVEQIQATLEKLQPTLIVNPAAYTAVDLAEQESELAFQINRDAVAEIAQYCKRSNTPLIHFSTDYVFSGELPPGDELAPYTETDQTGPTGVYGQSKLEGELAIEKAGAPALILRTAWVYSNAGKNFYKTMLSLAESRDELSVVADQVGAPTYAGSIAEATRALVDTILSQGGIHPDQIGVYHFTCQGQTSWCEFARAIFVENGVSNITVNGIPASDYPTPAQRPAFSVLDGRKLKSVFGITLPHWGTALSQCAVETKR